MIFDVMRMDNFANLLVFCGCDFCQHKEQREDVEHYKLFGETGKEYYLNIDKTNNKISIQEKL